MKFFNYEKDHFSEKKTFSKIEKSTSNILIFAALSVIITGGTNQLTEVQ